MPKVIQTDITIKNLNRQKLEQLIYCHKNISYDFTEDEINREIIKNLMVQIWFKLSKLTIKNSNTFTLKLSIAEAFAFYKVHLYKLHNYSDYQQAIFREMLTPIEKLL
jgi:hypothetical protein